MRGVGSFLKLLQYVPVIVEVGRMFKPKEADVRYVEGVSEAEIDEFKRDVTDRLHEMQEEQVRLRARVRDLEITINWMQTLLYIGIGTSIIFVILFLIAIIIRR